MSICVLPRFAHCPPCPPSHALFCHVLQGLEPSMADFALRTCNGQLEAALRMCQVGTSVYLSQNGKPSLHVNAQPLILRHDSELQGPLRPPLSHTHLPCHLFSRLSSQDHIMDHIRLAPTLTRLEPWSMVSGPPLQTSVFSRSHQCQCPPAFHFTRS